MRVRGLRGAIAVLFASTGLGYATGSARAEPAAAEPGVAEPAPREPQPDARGTRRQRDRAQREARQEKWWQHAREVLFRDIELSAEQAKAVDAIIEGQRAERKRADALGAELQAARQQGDEAQVAALRSELRASRVKLKGPHARIEDMRKVLTEAQRPTYDMNRARLASEGRKSREARQGARAKKPDGDAATDAMAPGADAGATPPGADAAAGAEPPDGGAGADAK